MVALRPPLMDRIPVSVHPTPYTSAGPWEARLAEPGGESFAAAGRTPWAAVRALASQAQVAVEDLTMASGSPVQLHALLGRRVRPEGAPETILLRQQSWQGGGAVGIRVDLSHQDWRQAALPEAVDLTAAFAPGLALRHQGSLVADGAFLAGATMRQSRFAGLSAVGACLAGANLGLSMMAGARLASIDAERADLNRALLAGVELVDADLTRASLVGADLTGADLTRACLHRAELGEACLRDARLSRADLTGADLSGTDLLGVDITGAEINDVVLTNAVNVPAAMIRSVVAWQAAAIGDHDVISAIQLVDRLRRHGLQAIRRRRTHLHPEQLVLSTGFTTYPLAEVMDPTTARAIRALLVRQDSPRGGR